jgi:hypothetical protein
MSKPSDNGQGLSGTCANGCAVLAVVIPAGVLALWAFGSWNLLTATHLVPSDIVHTFKSAPQTWQRIAGAAISLVAALILSFGLLRVRGSLMAFRRGDYFAAEMVQGLKAYAAASFWAAAVGIISVPILSIVLTSANGLGHREFTVDLSGAQFLNLLAAAILWVIAKAMARAGELAHENAQFV